MLAPLVIGIGLPIVVAKATHSPNVGWAFIAGIALIAGGYIAEWAWFSLAMYRDASRSDPMRDQPPRTIAEALALPAGTRVVVGGIVAPGKEGVVDAPLTGRDCVWAEAFLLTTKPGNRGPTIDKTSETAINRKFVLRDHDGATIAVDPRRGELTIPAISEDGSGPYAHRLERWVSDLRGNQEGASAGERALRIGDKVLAFGVIREEAPEDDAYRGKPRMILMSDDDHRLHVTTHSQEDLRAAHRSSRPIVSTTLATLFLGSAIYALFRVVSSS
jgi:hypothetical protein